MKQHEAPCATCGRKVDQLFASGRYECSHVVCPNRRAVTAQPSDGLLRDGGFNLTSHAPVRTSDGDNG